MYYNTLLALFTAGLFSSFTTLDNTNSSHPSAVEHKGEQTQPTLQQSPKLTGKWKALSRVQSSLAYGEKDYSKEVYKKPVIYDFSTPNKLKRTQDGEVETYKYKLVKNVITIYWEDDDMGEGEGSEYKLTWTNNRLLMHRSLPAEAPDHYTIDITLEAIK